MVVDDGNNGRDSDDHDNGGDSDSSEWQDD